MFGYRVPAPDQAMLISGGRRWRGGAPFKVVVGHGAFVLPFFRKLESEIYRSALSFSRYCQ